MACLKPVLGEEVSLVSELQQLEEVCTKLDKHTEDPFKLPEASEQVRRCSNCERVQLTDPNIATFTILTVTL